MAPRDNLVDVQINRYNIILHFSSSSWEAGQSSVGGLFPYKQTTSEWTRPKGLIWFVSRKECGSIGFVTFVPQLSALLLLLSMVFVGVHLKGFLPLRWKDDRMGRKLGRKEIIDVLNLMNNTWCWLYLLIIKILPQYLCHMLGKDFCFAL